MFQSSDESGTVLLAWWKGLESDRGERALLRRASNIAEVAFSPAYHRLLGRLKGETGAVNREALAAVAGLATHVKTHTEIGGSVARQMATPKIGGSGARVSGLRFRRLLAVSDRDELYPLLIRVVRLLDGNVNLLSLANGVYWWNESTRKQWAYDYYSTAPAEK
jgi:CRISPR system Cascade subunit CasB